MSNKRKAPFSAFCPAPVLRADRGAPAPGWLLPQRAAGKAPRREAPRREAPRRAAPPPPPSRPPPPPAESTEGWVRPQQASGWRSLLKTKRTEQVQKEEAPGEEHAAEELGLDEALQEESLEDAVDAELLEDEVSALQDLDPAALDSQISGLLETAEQAATPPPTLTPFSAMKWAKAGGRRFVGWVKSQKGAQKYYISCKETAAVFDGVDVKVTWKSNPPPELQVNNWVEFSVVEEYAGEWGSPLAVDVVITTEPKAAPPPPVGRRSAVQAPSSASRQPPRPSVVAATPKGLAAPRVVAAAPKSRGAAAPREWEARPTTVPRPPQKVAPPGRRAVAKAFQRVFLNPPEGMSQADKTAMLKMRSELELVVEDDKGCSFPPLLTFDELEGVVPDYVAEALASNGIEAPMPIQAQALPLVLGGHDLIGIAKTGSGKTLAYLLPAIVHIEAQDPLKKEATTPIALVLAPVRELAMQITSEAQRLIRGSRAGSHSPKGMAAVSLYGGGPNKALQIASLKKGCHIVVATPGRLVELIEERAISLERVTYFVLDEADRMLECGFEDALGSVSAGIRPDRQMLFFSTTWSPVVQDLAMSMCSSEGSPVVVTHGERDPGSGPASSGDIVQEVVVFDDGTWEERDAKKQELLYAHLLEVLRYEDHKVLVFVGRKDLADSLCNRIRNEGFRTESMHGRRTPERRLDIIESFKQGEIKLLVTTDVMARGLDIPDLSHVILYDMGEIEDYVHRIGRTAPGPYGSGHALTLFEYDRNWPHIPGKLIEVLEDAEQEVPEDLRQIAYEVANGLRGAKWSARCP